MQLFMHYTCSSDINNWSESINAVDWQLLTYMYLYDTSIRLHSLAFFLLWWWSGASPLQMITPKNPYLPCFSLEKGDLRIKTEALKRVIQQILNGEKMPSLLMVIIKFLMPLDDHTIKKLLLIFWEIVPKTGQDGKLLQEMILVCDAYRKVRVLIIKQDVCVIY